ncbi:phosphofurin acidic cluster sorting protein 2-like isoform 1, partial [Aphelenchoides avenae]
MDRTSPSAIQRVLTMLLTRIVLQKELKGESTLIIAVRLQGHKRTLRSNDFVVPATDVTLSDVEISLDISFTIQYWHFVKRKSNVLQLLVQRRKKYKNRKIPGFKTLAVGYINLDEVLQQGGIREIRVWDPASLNKADPDIKEMHAGSITVMNCQTQAVDTDFDGAKWGKSAAKEGASDDDAEEDSTPEDSDYEMNENDYLEQTPRLEQPGDRRRKQRMQSRKKMNQKNIKQRLVALLKRFKVPDEDNAVSVGGSSGSRMRPTAQELEEIFEELERISDSGPELEPDKMSIISNPRPGLRPFFGSRTDILPAIEDRVLSEGSAIESEEQEFSSELENQAEGSGLRQDSYELPNYTPDTPSGTRPSSSRKTADGKPVPLRDLRLKHSTTIGSLSSTNDARAVATGLAGAVGMPLSNVLNRKPVDSPAPLADMVLWKLEEQPPTTSGNVWLCSTIDIPWISRVQFSQIKSVHLTDCPSLAEVRAALQSIVGSIQKFCNTNSAMPSMTIIGLLGSDRLVSHALRAYVDLLQNKSSQEWLNYLRFALLVPPSSVIGRLMAQMGDSGYAEAS